jgi:hypothetical protein
MERKDKEESMTPDPEKLDAIRKLHEGYFNTDQDTDLFSKEFYYAVGEILSGKNLKDLKLRFLILEEIL